MVLSLVVIILATGATLYRDPTKDMPGVDYGMTPTNTPIIGDVLAMGLNGATWTTLTNFVRVWSGTSGGLLVPAAITNYLSPGNTSSNLTLFTSDVAGSTRCPVTRQTVLQNLYVVWTPAPGSGKTNFLTLYTNGVATTLAVQIVGTATNGNDVARAIVVPAGTEIGVRLATQSSATPGRCAWSVEGR
jgi:hypothetical protein